MDYLATFPDTLSVLHAEQILIRSKVPFETVPNSRFRKRCGLGLLFSESYLSEVQRALSAAELKFDLNPASE